MRARHRPLAPRPRCRHGGTSGRTCRPARRRPSPRRSVARSAMRSPGCASAAASARGTRTGRSCPAPSWRSAAACRGSAPASRRADCNGGKTPSIIPGHDRHAHRDPGRHRNGIAVVEAGGHGHATRTPRCAACRSRARRVAGALSAALCACRRRSADRTARGPTAPAGSTGNSVATYQRGCERGRPRHPDSYRRHPKRDRVPGRGAATARPEREDQCLSRPAREACGGARRSYADKKADDADTRGWDSGRHAGPGPSRSLTCWAALPARVQAICVYPRAAASYPRFNSFFAANRKAGAAGPRAKRRRTERHQHQPSHEKRNETSVRRALARTGPGAVHLRVAPLSPAHRCLTKNEPSHQKRTETSARLDGTGTPATWWYTWGGTTLPLVPGPRPRPGHRSYIGIRPAAGTTARWAAGPRHRCPGNVRRRVLSGPSLSPSRSPPLPAVPTACYRPRHAPHPPAAMNEQRPAASLQRFFSAPLAETDPELAAAIGAELHRQQDGIELIASENIVSAAVLEAQGLGADQQIRRGLSRPPLLRRLRLRRRGRAAGDRPRQAAVRLRVRQRAAAFRRAGQPGGVPRAAAAGRHDPGHEPRRRRPSDAWRGAEPVGQMVPRGPIRRAPRRRHAGLRGTGTPGARRKAEADHRRRLGLSALHRFRPHPPRRRRGRRLLHGGHGAFRRPGRRRPVPQPAAARPCRHHHDPQDAARPARRHGAGERSGDRQEDQLRGVPRPAGRPADARHRRQGRGVRRGAAPGIPRLPEGGRRQRQGAGRDPGRSRGWPSSPAAPTAT